jgi:rhodanese-related sulfurtransferase
MDVPEVDNAEAIAMREAGAAWIDVREPEEWAQARIEGMELVPMATVPDELPRRYPDHSTPIVVSCRSGARSAQVVAYLRSLGYEDVHNHRGGIIAWAAEGRSVVHGDA